VLPKNKADQWQIKDRVEENNLEQKKLICKKRQSDKLSATVNIKH
jgi:hypothetical protein